MDGSQSIILKSVRSGCLIHRKVCVIVIIYLTYSLTLREEHSLRVSEKRVLRGVQMAGGWRKLHSEKPHNL
jgi:hypothetical protein